MGEMNVIREDVGELQLSTCPICKGTPAKWAVITRLGRAFAIDRCTVCGFAFVNPRPSLAYLLDYYEHTGTERGITPTAEALRREEATDSTLSEQGPRLIGPIRALLPTRAAPTLLDVGCGYGGFSREAIRQGFRVTAIELAEEDRAVAREFAGVDPLSVPFEAFDAPPGSFDAIVMSQILEHAMDVNAWLSHAHELLASGGVLAIAVPNFGSLFRRVMQSRDVYVSPPSHLNYFTFTNLAIVVEQHGFRVARTRCVSRIPPAVFTRRFGVAGRLLYYGARAALSVADCLHLGQIIQLYAVKR